MAILQVREVPEQIYRCLAERAREDHRSIAQEALSLIEKGLGMDTQNRRRRQAVIEQVAASRAAVAGSELPDPAQLIREDRDR